MFLCFIFLISLLFFSLLFPSSFTSPFMLLCFDFSCFDFDSWWTELMYSMELRSLLPYCWTWVIDFLIKVAGKEYGDGEPSGRNPVSLFSGSCQIAHDWKAWPSTQISSHVESTRWNLETYRAKTQVSFLFKNRKGALFPFSFCKKKKKSHFLAWEDREEPSSSNTISAS